MHRDDVAGNPGSVLENVNVFGVEIGCVLAGFYAEISNVWKSSQYDHHGLHDPMQRHLHQYDADF